MANNTISKLDNKIKTLLAQKAKKSEAANKLNEEIKQIDAEVKELSALKVDYEKLEAKAAEKLG